MTRASLVVACLVLGACELHPRTLHEGLHVVVQRINEQHMLGDGARLDAFVDGERADLWVRAGDRTRLSLRLVPSGEARGLPAARWVLVTTQGAPDSAEARTIARLVQRVFVLEPRVVRGPRAHLYVRALFALVGAALVFVLARGLRRADGPSSPTP